MKTEKQRELIHSFLSDLGDDIRPVFRDIVECLSGHGYNPKKEGSNISFKHDLHNKQMAKMGIRKGKKPYPFFALRFSGCAGYSQRFGDIVREAITKYPSKAPRCTDGGCVYCAGNPDTHVYSCTFPDGERKTHCGAYALEITDVAAEDVAEIKKLIKEEHEYLMKYEVK